MQRKSLDVWVGLFVVLGAAALLFLALKAGNMSTLSFGKTYDVTARFDNIGGLKPGAPVKSAGVVVGRVDNIGLNSKTIASFSDEVPFWNETVPEASGGTISA